MKNPALVAGPGTNDHPITNTSPAMDPDIWSRLPKELLEQILSFLPLKTLWNLRSTCKHFKSLVFSLTFISKHSPSSSSSPSPFSSFVLLHHPQCNNRFPLYDSALGTWRDSALSLSDFLPCKSPAFSLLSISNGLFCFSLPRSSSFLVCNLLARTSRLIEFPSYPFAYELFTLVSTPFGYKLFMLSTGSTSTSAFVYDSSVLSWKQFRGFDQILSNNYQREGVYFNGCLYFLTPEPFSLVTFDLETGKWKRSDTELPGDLTFGRLLNDEEGTLYMIGGIGRDGISRSMKLWELNGARDWVEVESLPEMICRKFVSVCYHNYEHVYCFWHRGMICVCCHTWPEILYYKVSKKTWHWLPKCPYVPDKWSSGFKWFSFVPKLYAPV
ncbi:hypothetical protein F2P56_025619 [Juglans regia]|uniref:F-box/kelch-repeat protein At5g43190 n=2 Tax=Juglans regia TaxID=51240 RepID=A0A2I4H063_JUGRE|nr:F-box/kelch-repeat protein At5g43190 [Juglans regia]KAF5456108.1 hypothetical protein F2P56_025619 [Juglans regia]